MEEDVVHRQSGNELNNGKDGEASAGQAHRLILAKPEQFAGNISNNSFETRSVLRNHKKVHVHSQQTNSKAASSLNKGSQKVYVNFVTRPAYIRAT